MENNENLISGIQQVGIGVNDAEEAFKWYNKTLGLNVPVFDDVAEAKLMVNYTKGNIRKRRAILAVNMAGGGGAEIWESKKPLPIPHTQAPEIGDLGIFAVKFKCQNVNKFAEEHNLKIESGPKNSKYTWIKDKYENQLQVVEDNSWFKTNISNAGGVVGVIIGVSDMEKSLHLYKNILGLNQVIYDLTGKFEDLKAIGSEKTTYRRILLKKSESNQGAFTRLFGNIQIELIQAIDKKTNIIFKDRSWGDLGFIHICFDTLNMDKLGEKFSKAGFPFVVDSANSFDMGDAAGRFTYIQDPDGTLLEFVETHKVPILKKIGWYINLKKRKNNNPLPNWMINTLGWGKVKP
jgi:catechol 2,3-dioxygenase-like lactoylglutathione lyase family enzyme